MKTTYGKEVQARFASAGYTGSEIISDHHMAHLPEKVKEYIHLTGFAEHEKIRNVFLKASGQIRSSEKSGWMKFSSEQYNFFDSPFRAFYINARKMGIPATGLHLYKNETATMKIKLMGMFTIADAKGPEMNQAETVTLLNDMCFMAPGTLINPQIKWEVTGKNEVKAIFTNGNIKVSAKLFFDNDGRLVNFISNDRFETDGKTYNNYPWETPVTAYSKFGGYFLPSKADVIYKRPEGDFCYLKFRLEEIKYNVKKLNLSL